MGRGQGSARIFSFRWDGHFCIHGGTFKEEFHRESFRRSYAKHPTYKRFAGTFRSKGTRPPEFLRRADRAFHSVVS